MIRFLSRFHVYLSCQSTPSTLATPFHCVVRKPMESAPIPLPSNTPAFSHNIECDTQESDISFLSSQRQSMLSVKSLNKVFREATESTSIEFVYDLIALLT